MHIDGVPECGEADYFAYIVEAVLDIHVLRVLDMSVLIDF
jgi:hypothetical protein